MQINLEELPDGWEVKELGEVAEFLDNLRKPVNAAEREKRLQNAKQKYPYYGANGQQGWIDDYLFDEPLILLAEDGGFFNSQTRPIAYKIEGKTWVNNHAHVLKPGNKMPLDFLCYQLMFADVSGLVSGTTREKLNQERARQIKIVYAPLEVQQKIVSKLDAFFNEYNEAKKQHELAKTRTERVMQAAISKLIPSSEEELPEGWKAMKLSDACIINPRKSELAGLGEDTEVSFIPMPSISENLRGMDASKVKKLKQVKKGYTYFREGDVIFAKITPCMENGKVALVKNLKNGVGFGSTEFHVLRAKQGNLAEFILYYIWQPKFREEARRNMTGTAGQLRVPVSFLEERVIPVPPKPIQQEIVATLYAVYQEAIEIQKEQARKERALALLPNAVLRKAFRGGLAK